MTALSVSDIADATLPQARAMLRNVRKRLRQVAIEQAEVTLTIRQRIELAHEDAMLFMAEHDCLVRLGKRRRGGRARPDFRTRNIGMRAEE